MPAQAFIRTFLLWNINNGLCLPKALTLTPIQLYKTFAMLLLVRINQSVSRWGILNFCLLSDVFSYRLARGIPLKEESSVASTIQGQNSIPSSSLINSRVADITQCGTSTPSTTQRGLINSPTTMPVTISRSTPAPGGTLTRRVVSSPAFGIPITPTPPCCVEHLPTQIPNPEACAIITNPL
jgi:hypothetical protein